MSATETDAGFNFNNITQEVYGRTPQVGDNLLQMFDDGLPGGFNIDYDIGAAGPGDAMSEFKGYTHVGIYGGTWETYNGYRSPYVPDSVFQKYFSNGDLSINLAIQRDRLILAEIDGSDFDAPVTATLKIGGVTVSTTDESQGLNDDILFKINSDHNVPDGIYNWQTDVVVTLTDASGFQENAITYPVSADIFPQFIHIYGNDTPAYRWRWSTTNVELYPIVYPTATFVVTIPEEGIVPGTNSPAVNLKITDDAGFSDIEAYLSLSGAGIPIGNDTDGWVAVGSSFTVDTFKTLRFNVDVISNFIINNGSIADINLSPKVILKFGNGSFETFAVRDYLQGIQYYKVSVDNTGTGDHTWSWYTLETDGLGDPILDDPGGDGTIDPVEDPIDPIDPEIPTEDLGDKDTGDLPVLGDPLKFE